MVIFIAESYRAMSHRAADRIIELMHSYDQPLICPATGNSPEGLYKELVRRCEHQELNATNWLFAGLDEWVGMNGADEGSCRHNLNRQLFDPLKVSEDRICVFDGKAKDLEVECTRVESFIQSHGGIDVAIVGLGMNGHIGMNEPGIGPSLRSHIADLDPVTQQVGQKYFKEPQQLVKGLTLGLATIMEARHVVLLVSGKHKASIVQRALEGSITEQVPASILRRHHDLSVFLDKDAASELQRN